MWWSQGLNVYHSFEICVGPKALTSTTICKKCGVKTSSGRQERYILKTYLEFPYQDNNLLSFSLQIQCRQDMIYVLFYAVQMILCNCTCVQMYSTRGKDNLCVAFWSILVVLLECRFLDTEVYGSNPGFSMLCPSTRHFIRIASFDSAVKLVPGGDNLVRGVQCFDLFGGIALKNHAFFIFYFSKHISFLKVAFYSECGVTIIFMYTLNVLNNFLGLSNYTVSEFWRAITLIIILFHRKN